MINILVAARNEQACAVYKEMLCARDMNVSAATDGDTLRAVDISRFNVIIISLPLSNESGTGLFKELRQRTSAAFAAVVRADAPESLCERLTEDGAYVLKKPVTRSGLEQAARLLYGFSRNTAALRSELSDLTEKLEETKLLSRAKLFLISEKQMTEQEAHRYIQKTAMESRMSISEISRLIIDD